MRASRGQTKNFADDRYARCEARRGFRRRPHIDENVQEDVKSIKDMAGVSFTHLQLPLPGSLNDVDLYSPGDGLRVSYLIIWLLPCIKHDLHELHVVSIIPSSS